MAETNFRGQRQLAGVLLMAGLAIQTISLRWQHPVAFMTFLGVGCGLVVAGVFFYLLSTRR